MFWLFLAVAVLAWLTFLSTVARTTAVAERLLGTYAELLSAARQRPIDPEDLEVTRSVE